jgi:hypothetical protein
MTSNNRFERIVGRVFVESRRESMIGTKCLRAMPGKRAPLNEIVRRLEETGT